MLPLPAPKLILSDAERQRLDDSPDATFYSTPRMMQHADDDFIKALTSKHNIMLDRQTWVHISDMHALVPKQQRVFVDQACCCAIVKLSQAGQDTVKNA